MVAGITQTFDRVTVEPAQESDRLREFMRGLATYRQPRLFGSALKFHQHPIFSLVALVAQLDRASDS